MPFMRDGSQCLIADTSLQWLKDYQGSRNDLLTLRTGKAPEETMQKHQSGDPGEPQMEFKEFEPRFKSAKTWFKLSPGLNLETFDTILSGTNHL